MAGGFQVEESAIQTAIGHLTALLNEAETNDRAVRILGLVQLPGEAPETKTFHGKLMDSTKALAQRHTDFIAMVQAQLTQLQTQLRQYQAGESSAQGGFTNKEA
ncbi:MAG TPA: hypothetical protein VHW44_31220 [Pseudonocardiaceae bacterium]|nr:hypothetical protein [Pseudonocardiaceae bacterium]